MANEYIFAIGAHVLYWGSKDLANFIVKHVGRDAEDEPMWGEMLRANGLDPGEVGGVGQGRRRSGRGGGEGVGSWVSVAGKGKGEEEEEGGGRIPEAFHISRRAT